MNFCIKKNIYLRFTLTVAFFLLPLPAFSLSRGERIQKARLSLLKPHGERKAIRILTSVPRSTRKGEEWLWLGRAYLKKNPVDQNGFKALKKCLKITPDTGPFHLQALAALGEAYHEMGDTPKAMTLWHILRSLLPESNWGQWAQRKLGQVYLDQGDTYIARQYLEETTPIVVSSSSALFPMNLVNPNENFFPDSKTDLHPELNETKIHKEKIKKRNPPINFNKKNWNYAIQIAAYTSRDPAREMKNWFLRRGYLSFIRKIFVHAAIYYRVRVGQFTSRSTADRYLRKLKREEPSKAGKAIVVRRQRD